MSAPPLSRFSDLSLAYTFVYGEAYRYYKKNVPCPVLHDAT